MKLAEVLINNKCKTVKCKMIKSEVKGVMSEDYSK